MKFPAFIVAIITIVLFSNCTSKEKRIEKYSSDGIEKIRNSDNKGAIEDFTKIIELQDDNYEAYYYRANAKFNLKMAKEALLDYNKALELKPDFADGFYNRAFCKQFLNDKDGACKDWLKASALGKPNVTDLLNVCK
jgi:tetratricopeptide (TPR) repeat protein